MKKTRRFFVVSVTPRRAHRPSTIAFIGTNIMRIEQPVFAKAFEEDGELKLKVWDGDGCKVVSSPLLPYKYYRIEDLPEGVKYTPVLRKLLSSQKTEKLAKVEFQTLVEMNRFENDFELQGIQPTRDFINLINQHEPDFFNQFTPKDLTVLYFDIEQFVRKGDPFPPPSKPVISISYAFNDEPIQHYSVTEFTERDIVHKFANDLVLRDPDIIVGFNHCKYDVPVLEYKFKEFGIPTEAWSRENARSPFHYEKNIGPNTLQATSIEGRIAFDVFHCTLTDQTLSGQSRGLKSVAKHYQKSINDSTDNPAYRIDEIIEEDLDGEGTEYLLREPEKLRRYNNSDVQLARALFNFYFSNNKAVTSFVGAPLNKVVPMATTYAFTQILGNILITNNILADANNRGKYPWVFDDMGYYFDERDSKKKDQKPFQGALSDCFLPGLYFNHVEDDVGSLYPSLMASLGIGPDNTRIIKRIPFRGVRKEVNNKDGKPVLIGGEPVVDFKVERSGDVRTYYLPDTTRKWTWVVEVNGQSPVALKIKEFLITRLELKERAKKEASETLYAIAYALKVVLNSCYGIAGSAVLAFGELGVAVITTITGRMTLQEGMRFTGTEFITLVDTDSYKTDAKNVKPIEDVNAHFEKWTQEVLMGEPMIKWEREIIEAIFLKQPKTYLKLIKDKRGEYHLKKTGGAFKGTKYTNIFNKVIDEVGFTLLRRGEEAARKKAKEFFDMELYEPKDFIMTLKLGKLPDQYESPGAQAPTLAKLYEDKLGIKPYVGLNMRFVNTDYGYDVVSEKSLKNLDKKYYLQIVVDALERMHIRDVITRSEFDRMTRPNHQPGLDKWL